MLESLLLPQPGNVKLLQRNIRLQIYQEPPPIEERKEFEEHMLQMIQLMKFKEVNNQFLKKLKDNAECIKNETKLLIAADKTTNCYKLDPPTYNDQLKQNITKSYKKVHPNTTRAIHAEKKKIAEWVLLLTDTFITLKDHKPATSPINRPAN